MKPLVVFVALALTACSSAKAKPDAPAPLADGPIALGFDWPAGLAGTLTLDGSNEKDGKKTVVHATFGLTTSAAEDGVALKYEAREVELPGQSEQVRAMTEPMFRAIPTLLFRDGSVAGIRDFQITLTSFEELMAPLYETMPGLKEQLGPIFTEEMLLSSAQSEWEWQATAWHGRTMSVGDSIEEEIELDLPFVNGKAAARITMTLKEVLPCPGATARQCVRLERRLAVDPESAQAALGDLAKLFDSVALERTTLVELVAEPSTLLTYRMKKVEVTNVEMKRGETVNSANETKRTEEVYVWE